MDSKREDGIPEDKKGEDFNNRTQQEEEPQQDEGDKDSNNRTAGGASIGREGDKTRDKKRGCKRTRIGATSRAEMRKTRSGQVLL